MSSPLMCPVYWDTVRKHVCLDGEKIVGIPSWGFRGVYPEELNVSDILLLRKKKFRHYKIVSRHELEFIIFGGKVQGNVGQYLR